MAKTWQIYNGPVVTTAGPVHVTTGTAIKTLLQLLPTSTIRVVEWGISFDGTVATTPILVELVHTGTVAATVSGFNAFDVFMPFNDPNAGNPPLTISSSTGSGYTASAEGTVTTTRMGDVQQIAPTNQYVKQFPLGREFEVPASGILRVRVTAPAAVNALCYINFEA